MSYLLDTNICVAAINGRPVGVAERIAAAIARGQLLAVSTITVFELQYGVFKSARPEKNARAIDTFLRPFLILPFESDDAALGGEIRAALARKGEPIGPYDYLIAAQALRGRYVVVTANLREFARVPNLQCENWIA